MRDRDAGQGRRVALCNAFVGCGRLLQRQFAVDMRKRIEIAVLNAVQIQLRQFGGRNLLGLQQRREFFEGFGMHKLVGAFGCEVRLGRLAGAACAVSGLLDDFRDQIQAILGRGRAPLVVIAAVGFGRNVVAQTQRHVFLERGNRVIQGFDAGGVDRLHLLNQRKNAVEFVQGLRRMVVGKIELRQVREAFDIGKSKWHGRMARTSRAWQKVF